MSKKTVTLIVEVVVDTDKGHANKAQSAVDECIDFAERMNFGSFYENGIKLISVSQHQRGR